MSLFAFLLSQVCCYFVAREPLSNNEQQIYGYL
nr:MAG TPA: hypothetical protein [Caudoviricetes sp.]